MERSLIAMVMSVGVYVIGITSLLVAFAGAHNVLQFGYTGSIGPAKWGSLSPPFHICSNGTYQSPINIVKKDAVLDPKLKPLVRDYVDANSTLIDTGFNIALKFSDDAGSVLIDAKNYSLKQLQWHSPSEHTIDGVRYPVELQLVHTSADDNIAIVAILYQYGDPDPFLSKLNGKVVELAKEVCGEDEEAHIPVGVIETKGMRRTTRKYFRYVGSLTSPPCTENVIWTILGKVREISKEQVEALKAPLDVEYRNNSRPIQVLNGRKVYLYREGDGNGDDSD